MSSRPFERGSIVADRYRIIAPLGGGASANVYLADDLQLGRRVAVKVLREALAQDAAFLKRFRAETMSVAALNHPNIMHVYDSGEHREGTATPIPFLVMEFVGGGSLRAVLDAGPAFSPSQALVMGLDAARGLEYAHQQGFVHRDIKPANLLFGEEGRLRIADFGLARALAEATWTEPEGILLGTAKYSAPEQALGRPVDGRSDVYSLALVLVEAVTGVVPFARDTIQGTLMARTERDLEVPRSLGRLAPVLERAGRLDPELRPDAGELVIAFYAASEDMERPKPIKLPGAIPVSALESLVAAAEPAAAVAPTADAATTTATDEFPTVDRGDDVTLIAAPDQTQVLRVGAGGGSDTGNVATAVRPSVAPAAGGGGIDIPLDDSAPPVSRGGDEVDDDDEVEGRWTWMVASILIVALLAGAASVWWFAIRIPTHSVIDASGLSVSEATRDLVDLGFKVDTTFVRKDGTKRNEVVGQTPKAGTERQEGSKVVLTVSLGNTLVAVPELSSAMSEATVLDTLKSAGLKVGTKATPYDEVVPSGFLISALAETAPDATGLVPKGTKVDLVVSAGPQPRTMPPGLVGQPIDSVTRQLAELKLGINVTEEFSDQPIGTVLALNYADNAPVARDTVVEATVSKGPELFPIPNVIGQNGIQATKTLQNAGFGVAGITGSPTAPVVGVAPTVGEMHPKGTAVQILTNG
ncbi:MAG: protein kinase [Acidimicrobiales bacterium]